MRGIFIILLVACAGCLVGCEPSGVTFHATRNPDALSEWGLMQVHQDELQLDIAVTPYSLNSPLFSDYTHKLRTVWIPSGKSAVASEDGTIDFPQGTIFSKTFFYPMQAAQLIKTTDQGAWFRPAVGPGGGLDLRESYLLETRLLVKRATGWYALPYLWNAAQTEAHLEVTGAILPITLQDEIDTSPLSFNYVVPDQNQCAGCHATEHTTRAIHLIGPSIQNLDREHRYAIAPTNIVPANIAPTNIAPANIAPTNIAPTNIVLTNQLEHWQASGLLRMPSMPAREAMTDWRDQDAPLAHRARSYLHINCGHCHSKTGPADTSGLYLDLATTNSVRLGFCKLPIAAGQGTGGHRYSIMPGRPEASILVYRMESLAPGAMMPEFGRSTVHQEGLTLVSNWIASLEGSCGNTARSM